MLISALILCVTTSCNTNTSFKPVKPELSVSADHRYLVLENGNPFLWLGGTVWGMSEWLSREEIDIYLNDRKSKGFNVVQICLFWGKREDDPVGFTVNPTNYYGFKAFRETDGKPDASQPLIIDGGTPLQSNDYWDHVEYIIQSANELDMMVALLPVWGRRYVNATHANFSEKLFTEAGMAGYGKFLGQKFKSYSNIIWVMGGDVQPDLGGNYLNHYRAMA